MIDLTSLILGSLISIPIGIFINLITPKIQTWFATRTQNSIATRIKELEQSIEYVERLISQPSFAIAKFTNIQLRAIIGLIAPFFIVSILITLSGSSEAISTSTSAEISAQSTLFGVIIGMFLMIGSGWKTIELYALTYRIEHFVKWKAETLKEIQELQSNLDN